jgi:hypothetical protein
VAFRPAIAAVDLQRLAISNEVANRHRLEAEWLRLATALGPVPFSLQLD